jgi:ABC-type uncharacterized transport system ATPase subunit
LLKKKLNVVAVTVGDLGNPFFVQIAHGALDGKPVHLRTPHESRLAGIGIIYQELTVAPNLTVSGNVFLGSELNALGS